MRSALLSSSLDDVAQHGNSAIPILTVSLLRILGRFEGKGISSRADCILWAINKAFSFLVLGNRIINSSPPYRAAWSISRILFKIILPNSYKIASPAKWPRWSLIALKLSISMIINERHPIVRKVLFISWSKHLIK